ncbi:MAG: HNH endonuclease [Candidatus Methylomirabilis sp.]
MRAYVAVTDNEWFRFLRSRAPLDEVNFWQPGGSRLFKTLSPGEPFLFKLHYPEHFIVGGGFFAHSSIVPASLAWEAFGEKNGAVSFERMYELIAKRRRIATGERNVSMIGCVILQDPFFFDERDWIQPPKDFDKNIVQGKTYDLGSSAGKALWDDVLLRLHGRKRERVGEPDQAPYGDPVLVRQRLGQGTFRVLITDIYERRCAVTGEKALPALDAAHIKPVSEEGRHRIDNGLLLRSDIHKLLDAGYVTVAPDYRFVASRKLKNDFDNGEEYLQLTGSKLWLPKRSEDRPNREFLEWHADVVFRR